MIHTLNEIADTSSIEVGVHNRNEVIMHEYWLDAFIQIQHDVNEHGQGDDIR